MQGLGGLERGLQLLEFKRNDRKSGVSHLNKNNRRNSGGIGQISEISISSVQPALGLSLVGPNGIRVDSRSDFRANKVLN